jgi:hypothetical protein
LAYFLIAVLVPGGMPAAPGAGMVPYFKPHS